MGTSEVELTSTVGHLQSEYYDFWVTQTARIKNPPSVDELTHRGGLMLKTLGKSHLSNVAVVTGGSVAVNTQAEELRQRARDGLVEAEPTLITFSGLVRASGFFGAWMTAAPEFMTALTAGAFDPGWQWVEAKVKLLERQDAAAQIA